jgi:hypothetical protein
MTQEASIIVPQQEPTPALLPTYPQHLIATLTPRQLRAALAGQRYYLTHQSGRHLSHAQLCTFIKAKYQRWQYTNTSLDWQIHFIGGWHAALLADPTAEKQPAAIQAGPEGQDGGWCGPLMAQPTRGREDGEDAPIKAQQQEARPTCGKDDEDAPIKAQQEARPIYPDKDEEDGDHHPNPAACDTAAAVTMIRPGGERDDRASVTEAAAISARPTRGPENDDEPGEAPIKAAAALQQHITAALALLQPQHPSEDPDEDEDEELATPTTGHAHSVTPSCYVITAQQQGAMQARPIWEPEDDDDGGRHHPAKRGGDFAQTQARGGDFAQAQERGSFPRVLFGPKDGGEPGWYRLTEQRGGDFMQAQARGGNLPRLLFGPDGGGEPGWCQFTQQRGGAFIPAPVLGDEDDKGPGWMLAPWLVIRSGGARGSGGPQWPIDDDGSAQRPAFPTFPRKPAPTSAAAILVACHQQTSTQEAAAWI